MTCTVHVVHKIYKIDSMNGTQIWCAIDNLNTLIAKANSPASKFSFAADAQQIKKNWFFKSTPETINKLRSYLQTLIDTIAIRHTTGNNQRLYNALLITLQGFLHLQPNRVLADLQLDMANIEYLQRKDLIVMRLSHTDPENQFSQDIQHKKLPEINYDKRTGHYTSPDDDKAHQHGAEGRRIFLATQWERFKAFCNWCLEKIGVYVFEEARYKEHDYLESDIYTNDSAIDFSSYVQTSSHYWIGHASNLITIPTHDSPLHVLTDPVEGDLAPILYPRMTKEGSLINGTDYKKLPKIDVVVISHNHRDHVSTTTLKRLLNQQPKMIVPEGDESFFLGMGFKHVVGLKWWEQAQIKDKQGRELLRVTAVPVRHWSGRTLADAHRAAFNGYVMHSFHAPNDDIYFAGDTALMQDTVSQPIFERFNISTSLQPGGPDERRADMESTHQSSADGILVHFKILYRQYLKMKVKDEALTLDQFIKANLHLKTIYNHTATFKLGNLRLRDTYYSYLRMITAFKEGPQWRADHLPDHELKVYTAIQSMMQGMVFADNERFNDQQMVDIILRAVIVPKIGQRQQLYVAKESVHSYQYRDLITNRRALIEFDAVVHTYVSTPQRYEVKEAILKLLDLYQRPRQVFFSRTYAGIEPFKQVIRDCITHDSLLASLNNMERNLGKRNQHGHMQSLIHYAKWLLEFSIQAQDEGQIKLKGFFDCQKLRQFVEQEIYHGSRERSSFTKKSKQDALKTLSNQLAELPADMEKYQRVIYDWQAKNPSSFFTQQELVVEQRMPKVSIGLT